MFSWMVPENREGSWKTTPMSARSSSRGRDVMSVPAIRMDPTVGVYSRRSRLTSVVLPPPLAMLLDEALDHANLTDDLREAASGNVELVVLLGLKHLPLRARDGRQPHEDGVDHGQKQGQRPGVERCDRQDRHDGQHHLEERVREHVQEARGLGDGS